MQIPSHVLKKLEQLTGPGQVQTEPLVLALNGYDCSGSTHRPDAVVHITSVTQLEPIIGLLSREKIPFVVRAAATNHAGSCAAVKGGVVLNLNALNQLYTIDTQQGFADADPCLVTGVLQGRLKPLGFFYAPDPASEQVCTLGGNLAQNASGARCIKYGNTSDNTLQIEFITPDGYTHILKHDDPGPDLLGLVAGSEGTLGIIKRMRVRILPAPKQIQTFLVSFPSLEDAVQTVTDLIASGLTPRCIEAMDKVTVQAIESFTPPGYPQAEALLIIELDGNAKQIKQDTLTLQKICTQNHCQLFTQALSEEERQSIWHGRQAAYSAMAALAPNVAVADGTVPRSELPRALQQVRQIIDKYGIQASLLFHAGDGNFHPQLIFDASQPTQTKRIQQTLQEILKTCVDCGGTISGEHGIGVQKRALMAYQYSRQTLRLFAKIKKAFDPYNLANPDKIIPIGFEDKAALYEEKDPAVCALAVQIKQRFDKQQPTRITAQALAQEPYLSTHTLDKILDIDKTNYTATVQAGVYVNDLIKALQAQQVYAKLPEKFNGTLGALVATKAAVDFTSQLTGIAAILPNADIVQYGGKLTKNAAGYNLCRLFVGSWGALGLITQVTFKIYPVKQNVSLKENTPFKPTALFTALKQTIDPQHLFLSAVFEKEGL